MHRLHKILIRLSQKTNIFNPLRFRFSIFYMLNANLIFWIRVQPVSFPLFEYEFIDINLSLWSYDFSASDCQQSKSTFHFVSNMRLNLSWNIQEYCGCVVNVHIRQIRLSFTFFFLLFCITSIHLFLFHCHLPLCNNQHSNKMVNHMLSIIRNFHWYLVTSHFPKLIPNSTYGRGLNYRKRYSICVEPCLQCACMNVLMCIPLHCRHSIQYLCSSQALSVLNVINFCAN